MIFLQVFLAILAAFLVVRLVVWRRFRRHGTVIGIEQPAFCVKDIHDRFVSGFRIGGDSRASFWIGSYRRIGFWFNGLSAGSGGISTHGCGTYVFG